MQFIIRKQYLFHQSPLYQLNSKRKLASILHISYSSLIKLISIDKLYLEQKKFNIKKQIELDIQEPKPFLKKIHKRIKTLLDCIELSSFIYSLRKGFSYIDNAKLHAGNCTLRKLDIKSYFTSTPSQRVFWFFHKRMKCSKDISGILTKLLTFKGCLPTGSPSSPILSHYAHLDMWESIDKIVTEANCTLSVWVDDITVSGKTVPTQVMWAIKKAIKRNGLS